VTDLVEWEKALSDRKLLSEDSMRRLLPPTAPGKGESQEHGFAVDVGKLGEFRSYSHTGGVGGFRVCLVHYPLPRITIAILANCATAPVDRIERDVARFVLSLPAPAPADLALAPEEAARFVGMYQIATSQVQIELKDGKLWYAPANGQRTQLLHRGNMVFGFENDAEAQLTFDVREGKCEGFTVLRGGFTTTGKRMG
jgi:hypothetical protein